MKTVTDVLPLLLNILPKTPITQLSLPRLHTLITATAKQSFFTNSLFPCKKEMNTQRFEEARTESKLFTAFLPWQELNISSDSDETPNQDFLSSVSYMIKIWKAFWFRGSENTGSGLDSVPKESNGKALLNLTVPDKLLNFCQALYRNIWISRNGWNNQELTKH